MQKTPGPYRFGFFQQGDLYSAAVDFDRMVVTDNQLQALAAIIGDGVLSGWTVCHSGLDEIEVHPGVGFIRGVVNKTLSIKKKKVLDNVPSFVYMQSKMFTPSGGFNIETESPASNLVVSSFIDTVPPAQPTSFIAVGADFNLINLFWDANTETDFDHYILQRSTVLAGPYLTIANPLNNGVNPSAPYQDKNLSAATTYYYKLAAVDHSGNVSTFAIASTTTLADTRKPGEPGGFLVFPSNTMISMTWNASATPNVVYKLTLQELNPDGSANGAPIIWDNILTLYWQVASLSNGSIYHITLQAKTTSGVLSDGSTADATPTSTIAPLDVLLYDPLSINPQADAVTVVTPLTNSIRLAWVASPSPTGTAIGQKQQYQIRVTVGGVESAPLNQIGTSLVRTVVSYNDVAAVGQGLNHTLVENTDYSFRITSLDAVGNESAGMVVKGRTPIVTPPNDPRFLQLVPGDSTIKAFWKHSSSSDVVGYIINVKTGLSFGPDLQIGYLTQFIFGTTQIGSTTGGSNIVTIQGTSLLPVNSTITGTNIPIGTIVQAILSPNTIQISNPAIATGSDLTFTFNAVTNGIPTTIKIRSVDSATPTPNISAPGVTGTSVPFLDTVPPAIPIAIRATPEDQQVVLTWQPNTEPDLDHYIVKRSAIAQNLQAIATKNLTVITFFPKAAIIGTVLTATTSVVTAAEFVGPIDFTGFVLVMTSGPANGQNSVISSFNMGLGVAMLATPFTVAPLAGDTFELHKTDPSLGTSIRNVGLATDILDIALVNGQTYAYYIQAVDHRGNASAFSAPILVSPNCGLNDLNAPTNLTAIFSGGSITLAWQNIVPTPDHPAVNHNAFNIYRSTNQFSGFELIDSVPASFVSNALTSVVNAGDLISTALIGITGLVGATIIMRSGPAAGQQSLIATANLVTGEITLTTPFTVLPTATDTFDISQLTFVDTNLLNNTAYYYIVTAVRDDADAIIDNGAIAPPNSILLAKVTINASTPLGCEITAIQNQQRLLDQLNATIAEETNARILAHKHTVRPLNRISVDAVPLLATIDATILATFSTTGLSLSPKALAYYQNLALDSSGKAIPYDHGTTYFISPSSIVSDLPYVGDFQVLVNGEKPTVEFAVDPDRNAVLFPIALKPTDIVTLDGGGFSYYVPAMIDLGFRGFDILVNGNAPAAGSVGVDEPLQTIRFVSALQPTDIVTILIDPVVPDFGSQQGARQVSLNPNIVLSDFSTKNNLLFESATGAFDSTDTFFVLVDGVRTVQAHSVDTTLKTITFDSPIATTSTVSLEILNREEVQKTLPINRFTGVDGASFRTGQFLKAQLPPISHDGRVKELALPIFQQLTTANKYIYDAPTGIIGDGTTPYAVFQFDDGTLFLGTSGGLLKTDGFSAFTSEGETSTTVVDYSQTPPSGLKFTTVAPDAIVDAAKAAKSNSGRAYKEVQIITTAGGAAVASVAETNLVTLDDGRILISGGYILNTVHNVDIQVATVWIYDPIAKFMTQAASLNVARYGHSSTVLPNGNILITGGVVESIDHFTSDGGVDAETFTTIASVEIYDVVANAWFTTADMTLPRTGHTCNLLTDSQVLVAGGQTGISFYDGRFNPVRTGRGTLTQSAEIYDIGFQTWGQTATLNRTRVNATSNTDSEVVIVTGGGQDGRELFSLTPSPNWTLEGAQTETTQSSLSSQFGLSSIDGPVKQFLKDSLGLVLAVSRNSVYATNDEGDTFIKTKGLDAVGVVHRISQSSDGTLFAATDLGIYEITPDIHDSLTWFQGGLIGLGTTETFDLQPFGTAMLAATEIGIFTSSDDGNTWTQLNTDGTLFSNVYNIEAIGSILFLNAGNIFYRSDDSGLTWTKITALPFVDENSRMISRSPLDIFFTTSTGLYATRDGIEFFLVDFDQNRHPTTNNVHMADVIGSDLVVGYDNLLISVGPSFETLVLAEFVGVTPTVRINGIEIRDGFRFDNKHSQVVFEFKRFVNDIVDATSNYGLYQMVNGPWYRQHPNASILIFKNGAIQDDSTLSFDARLGQITFVKNNNKADIITATISGTTLKDGGEFYHNELEDRFELEKGLPLSLGRDYAGNILQMGLSAEHNFLERGIERNQYYCAESCLVDRGFTSFLQNAEFYISGRRQFDRFNSTIDYSLESEQLNIGARALMPLSALQVSSNLWVGTENGIFVLDPSASFAIAQTIQIGENNPIRDMQFFQGNAWLVTKLGIYETTDGGITFSKNEGNGLPTSEFVLSSLGNVLLVGTDDTIYYSDGQNQDPPYSIWFRGVFVEGQTTQEFFASGICTALTVSEGVAYAGIGRSIFISIDGKTWQHVFDFPKGTNVLKLITFAKRLFVGTNKGVFSDDGSARTVSPSFRIEAIDPNPTVAAALSVNDMFTYTDGNVTSLYVAGNTEIIYRLSSEAWTQTTIPGAVAIQKFIIVSGPRQVAISNDVVFVE